MILLIDPAGQSMGKYSLDDASIIAEEQFGLELLEVRPDVFKIVDLGKLKYEASKRKQPKSKPLKEMKFKLNIGTADYETKINHINKFLSSGSTVKVTVWFSGREVTRPEMGNDLLQEISKDTSEFGHSVVNSDLELQGKNMYLTIEPHKIGGKHGV